MIIILHKGVLYYPRHVTNQYGQGIGADTYRCYNNFAFFALTEVGDAPVLHYAMKSYRAPTLSTFNQQLGVYVDVTGMVTALSCRGKVHAPGGDKHVEILQEPFIRNVDDTCDGWSIVAYEHKYHDCAAALMHLGTLKPHEVISKTMEIFGEAGYRNICSVTVDSVRLNIKESFIDSNNDAEDSKSVAHQMYLERKIDKK